jgi:redox-sensing transcriptional repressor
VDDRDEEDRDDEPRSDATELSGSADCESSSEAAVNGALNASPADSIVVPETRQEIPVNLPRPAVGRLSLYFRELHRLLDSDVSSVNSQELGPMVDVSPAVVRRDLSALGTIGRRGVGYDVATLVDRIGSVLGSGAEWNVVLVGVGSLGDALLRYRGFERLGFRLSGAFDNDAARIGTAIGGIEIVDVGQLESVLAAGPAELAILAVPAEYAAEIAARLVACKVSGILNFAPTTLRLPAGIAVVNVDLASELQRLAFSVQRQK